VADHLASPGEINAPRLKMGDSPLSTRFSPDEEAMVNTQVAVIRDEIRLHGESIADCAKLLVLCPEVAVSGQWGEIAQIAIREGWSFTFFPNGDVRFAPL